MADLYDNVVIQRVQGSQCGKYPNGLWRVNRYGKAPKEYHSRDEAYQAAIQILFDAKLEYDPDPIVMMV